MNRRGFLSSMLACGMAPAIVKAANLMPVFVRHESGLLVTLTGNRPLTIHEITREALRMMQENSTFIGTINRQFNEFPKHGDVLTIRRPEPYRRLNAVFDDWSSPKAV